MLNLAPVSPSSTTTHLQPLPTHKRTSSPSFIPTTLSCNLEYLTTAQDQPSPLDATVATGPVPCPLNVAADQLIITTTSCSLLSSPFRWESHLAAATVAAALCLLHASQAAELQAGVFGRSGRYLWALLSFDVFFTILSRKGIRARGSTRTHTWLVSALRRDIGFILHSIA